MKYSMGVAAALAGFAAASQPADVYILSQSPDSTTQLGRSIAHLIFLQRLSTDGSVGSLSGFPEDAIDAAVSNINKFGKQPQALFSDASRDPSQLLIMLEGITSDNHRALEKALERTRPSFQVTDTPSSVAHRSLAQKDLASAGAVQTKCELERAINPLEEDCWSGKSSVAMYDVKKDPHAAQALADNVPRLIHLALIGEMDTTLVFIPDSTRSSSINAWSPSALRRRETEEVMTELDESAPTPASSSSPNTQANPGPFAARVKDSAIPACFTSLPACQTTTGNCSGHGSCEAKWPNAAEGKQCFFCSCKKDANNWAGATCNKYDVSTPFWLFAGTTLGLLGIVTFAVTLLFNVGEEKLPGVIGAGVSKAGAK